MISENYDLNQFVQECKDIELRSELLKKIEDEVNEANIRQTSGIKYIKSRSEISGYVVKLGRLKHILTRPKDDIIGDSFKLDVIAEIQPLLENLYQKGEYSSELMNQLYPNDSFA